MGISSIEEEKLWDFVDGNIDALEKEQIESLIKKDPEIQRRIEAIREFSVLLDLNLEYSHKAPDGLNSKIINAFENYNEKKIKSHDSSLEKKYFLLIGFIYLVSFVFATNRTSGNSLDNLFLDDKILTAASCVITIVFSILLGLFTIKYLNVKQYLNTNQFSSSSN